jgi:hypothetical protein
MNEFNDLEAESEEWADRLEAGEIEISNLPPGTSGHHLLLKLAALQVGLRRYLSGLRPGVARRQRLTRRQRRARMGQALVASGLCAMLLLLLIGNMPALRTRLVGLFESPTSTSTPSLLAYGSLSISQSEIPIRIDHHISPNNPPPDAPGALPATCPKASTLQNFTTPLDPPGLGGGPVWITGFIGPVAAVVDLKAVGTSMSHPPGGLIGWYATLPIFIQKGFNKTLILQGGSQGVGEDLQFASADSLAFGPSIALTLSNLASQQLTPDGSWEMLPVNVFIPLAGCYALQAFWFTDSWTRYFAAGS